MDVHPAAQLFPLIEGVELVGLADDIETNGQRETIKLLEGKVLDGRNRLAACEAKGIEPRFEDLPPDTDPVAYVISANVKRRNMTASQLAISAAKAWDGYAVGQGKRTDLGVNNPEVGVRTKTKLAALFGVGEKSVQQARALVERDPSAAAAVLLGLRPLVEAYAELRARERGLTVEDIRNDPEEMYGLMIRRQSEILKDEPVDEWVGLAEFDESGAEPLKIVVSVDNEEERAALLELLGVDVVHKKTGKTFSTWWPPREKEDLSSLRFGDPLSDEDEIE